MRSKTLFGEDAEMFRPERFLEADEATRVEMQRNVELTFGYGRWMCAGKAIAFLEINKTVFEVRYYAPDMPASGPPHWPDQRC